MSRRRGEVVSFDEQVGLGIVRDSNDDTDRDFHCTALVDGTRSIEVGAKVYFDVSPGHGGRFEATRIEKV